MHTSGIRAGWGLAEGAGPVEAPAREDQSGLGLAHLFGRSGRYTPCDAEGHPTQPDTTQHESV